MIFDISTNKFEGSSSYFKGDNGESTLDKYSNSIYYNKYSILNKKESFIVLRSRIISRKEFCTFNGI